MELPEFLWLECDGQNDQQITWKFQNNEYEATYTFSLANDENRLDVQSKKAMTRQTSIEGVQELMSSNTFKVYVCHSWNSDRNLDIGRRLEVINRELASALVYINGLDTAPDSQ